MTLRKILVVSASAFLALGLVYLFMAVSDVLHWLRVQAGEEFAIGMAFVGLGILFELASAARDELTLRRESDAAADSPEDGASA